MLCAQRLSVARRNNVKLPRELPPVGRFRCRELQVLHHLVALAPGSTMDGLQQSIFCMRLYAIKRDREGGETPPQPQHQAPMILPGSCRRTAIG